MVLDHEPRSAGRRWRPARLRVGRERVAAGRQASGAGADDTSVRDRAVVAVHDGARPPLPASPEELVPTSVRYAAAWSWRILLIAAAVALLGWVSWQLRVVTFPMVVAVLLAALLAPTTMRLRAAGWRRGAAAGVVLATFVVVVVGVLTIVGRQVSGQFGQVADEAQRAVEQIQGWLSTGPLQLSQAQVTDLVDQVGQTLAENQDRLAAGALSTAGAAAEVFAGIAIALFALFFFLFDGRNIWTWFLSLAPRSFRADADETGRRAFGALIAYVRSTVLVATFDGVFITIWLLVLSVPLALPLGVLVFFGAFIPLVGAFASGALAVLVAFVTQGPIIALLVLLGIIAVQQIEAHLFAPLVMGRMVRLHPLAIVLAISAGAVVFGIIGAIVAVPLLAVVHTAATYLRSRAEGLDVPDDPTAESVETRGDEPSDEQATSEPSHATPAPAASAPGE